MGHNDAHTALTGFGNEFQSEAVPGALPIGQNSPQRCPFGLYAEQLSGSAFTAPRATNQRAWLYRVRPSVAHLRDLEPVSMPLWQSAPPAATHQLPPLPLRWDPVPMPDEGTDFVSGMRTITVAGDVSQHDGVAIHLYFVNTGMSQRYFVNADGELLVLPQQGRLRLHTEFGVFDVSPGDVAVLPRGVKFRVMPLDEKAIGYVCENYGARFCLPERGPIGANGLANPRDFVTPAAAFESNDGQRCELVQKWCGRFYASQLDHSPLDVVAWHGNYVPYSYSLRRFSPVGSVLIDHPDPSIFTVLTSASHMAGTANVDFVIFPPRWMVAENTFRPPWYHVNVMSEFMGLIEGAYDAKPQGFVPGGMSLHNAMVPHGPDSDAYRGASEADLVPHKLDNTLAFMFETRLPQHVTAYAAALPQRQSGYQSVWDGLPVSTEFNT